MPEVKQILNLISSSRSFKFLLLVSLVSSTLVLEGQDCALSIRGSVKDASTDKAISFATVFINELGIGAASDSDGKFNFSAICPGSYHIKLSHIGCSPIELHLDLNKDTNLVILMNHSEHSLNHFTVEAEHHEQHREALSSKQLTDKQEALLAEQLEALSGVYKIGNGSSMSQPLVHGHFGNRLLVLNQGIPHASQNWGIDHATEIDPLNAEYLEVVKGASNIEFQGSSLGSVVSVKAPKIEASDHLHGKLLYFFESNGLGNGLGLTLNHKRNKFAWQINASGKKRGDQSAPNYYLNNTGFQQANASLRMEYQISKKLDVSAFASSFNSEQGILRGAHIGNLSDLSQAYSRETPFFTEQEFSYKIEAPRQEVGHHMLRLNLNFVQNLQSNWELSYAYQVNNRREFDVRRSGRVDLPALSLAHNSNFLELKHKRTLSDRLFLKFGIQNNVKQNTNNPETGILPLIPDYIQYVTGVFVKLQAEWLKTGQLGLGARVDRDDRRVASISQSLPREIIRNNEVHLNGNSLLDLGSSLTKWLDWNLSLGYASRAPGINELYSNGLHQGVGGIELGNSSLSLEEALKANLLFEIRTSAKWRAELLTYYQNIQNYIFLAPSLEERLTIRGAFPVFEYQQTRAEIYGSDFSISYDFIKNWNLLGRCSALRGRDISADTPLLWMPPWRMNGQVKYVIPSFNKFRNIEFRFDYRYQFSQTNLRADQDFYPVPEAYQLFGFRLQWEQSLFKKNLACGIEVNNLLNTEYRDYLNRLRYFADEPGRNVVLRLNYKF